MVQRITIWDELSTILLSIIFSFICEPTSLLLVLGPTERTPVTWRDRPCSLQRQVIIQFFRIFDVFHMYIVSILSSIFVVNSLKQSFFFWVKIFLVNGHRFLYCIRFSNVFLLFIYCSPKSLALSHSLSYQCFELLCFIIFIVFLVRIGFWGIE